MQADLILAGGTIETMLPNGAVAEAVAVREGRFAAVGTRGEVEAWAGPGTRRIDLAGATLLPGFWDTHMHLHKIARELAMVHLDGARSLEEVLAAVAGATTHLPPGAWIQSFGDDNAWHEAQLAERTLPDRHSLDRVAPLHPVFLFRGPDVAVLNSPAIQAVEERLASEFRDGWDAAVGRLQHPQVKALQRSLPAYSGGQDRSLLEAASLKLLAMGITGVVDPGLPAAFAESWQLFQAARAAGQLKQRVYLMNRFDYRRSFGDEMERLLSSPALPLDGDDFLRAWAVKLLLDGEFVDAWMRSGEPAVGAPAQRYRDDELDAILHLCGRHGWPLCVHALGGGAIDRLIERIKQAWAQGVRFTPAQISLAHAFFPSPANLADCRRYGIALAVQPLLMDSFAPDMMSAWGPFAEQATPMAGMLAAGVITAGGSDVLPCEPLRGARMAVTRIARRGDRFAAQERIAPRHALELFTRQAGVYIGRKDIGMVAPGCVADFAVWSANPLQTPPGEWLDLEVLLAGVGGRVVWEP